MGKAEKGNNRKLREYLSSFAEVAECLSNIDVPLECFFSFVFVF